jgi:hypothetical protein
MRLFIMLLPWLELFTLIQLGIETSALTAIGYVLATLALGVLVLQRQGQGMFERLREAQEGRIIGPQLLLDDMAMGLAGLLLIIPGSARCAGAWRTGSSVPSRSPTHPGGMIPVISPSRAIIVASMTMKNPKPLIIK